MRVAAEALERACLELRERNRSRAQMPAMERAPYQGTPFAIIEGPALSSFAFLNLLPLLALRAVASPADWDLFTHRTLLRKEFS